MVSLSSDGTHFRQRQKRTAWLVALLGLPFLVLLTASIYQHVASAQDRQRFPPPGKLVDVGGYRLHVYCTGQHRKGEPTAVFEGGLGASSIGWRMVQEGLTPHMRVCSYDRAGYGWSEAGPRPRTAKQIVKELHALLSGAGEQAPYILVGHSFGGIVIRQYAGTYPTEVAGLVFVDARHEDFFRRMPAAFLKVDEANLQRAQLLSVVTPIGMTRLAGNLGLLDASVGYLAPLPDSVEAEARALMIYNPSHWQTSVAEREVIQDSFDDVRRSPLPFSLPLIVLTAENGIEAWRTTGTVLDEKTRETWMNLQRELAALSVRSQWLMVKNSGHYIYLDRPDAVTASVLSVRDMQFLLSGIRAFSSA